MKLRNILPLVALSLCVIVLGACSIPERGPGVPVADTTRALPLGIPNARFFADGDPRPMIEEGTRAFEREQAAAGYLSTLAVALESGVPLLRAMSLARGTVGND